MPNLASRVLEPGPLLGEPDDAAGGPGPGVAGGLGELVAALAQVVLVRVDHLGEGRGRMVEVECTVAKHWRAQWGWWKGEVPWSAL